MSHALINFLWIRMVKPWFWIVMTLYNTFPITCITNIGDYIVNLFGEFFSSMFGSGADMNYVPEFSSSNFNRRYSVI